MIPGDPEREKEAVYKKEGIPLLDSVVKDLKTISVNYNVPFIEN